MKTQCISSGISLIFLALILGGAALFALLDPVSTKMADDGDPFGPPLSRAVSVFILGASTAIGVIGVYLIRRSVVAKPRG